MFLHGAGFEEFLCLRRAAELECPQLLASLLLHANEVVPSEQLFKLGQVINGLAALRKACIIGTVGTPDAGNQRALRVSLRTPNLKAARWLAVDRPGASG